MSGGAGIGRRAETWLLLAPAVLLVTIVFAIPILRFFGLAFTAPEGAFSTFAKLFETPVYRRILINTFVVAAVVTVITAVLAWPVAYALARARGRTFTLLLYGVLFPLWISVLVRAYSWMLLLERNGPINRTLQAIGLTDAPITMLFNQFAVLVGMVHLLFPYMVLPLYGSMSRIDRRLMMASDGLGAGLWQSFRRVWLPLSLPGLAGGATFVFLLSLGFYITPALLGGRTSTMLPTLIVSFISEHLNWPMAAAASVTLLGIVAVLGLAALRFLRLDRGDFLR